MARISSEREDVGEHIELNKQLQYPPFSAKIGTDTFRGRYLFWQANSFSRTKLQGPVVRRPISTSLGLNINPAFFISLFKNPFWGKIFPITFRESNDEIASKNIWTELSS